MTTSDVSSLPSVDRHRPAPGQRKTRDVRWSVLELHNRDVPHRPHIVLVERTVHTGLRCSTIRLEGWHIAGDGRTTPSPDRVATFGGRVDLDRADGAVFHLTAGSTMEIAAPLKGFRLGSYLFNEIVRWAIAQNRPGRIAPIGLFAGDARTEAARDRRNRFYERFGLRFDWVSGTALPRAEGRSVEDLSIEDLRPLDRVPGVVEREPAEALRYYTRRMHAAETERAAAERAVAAARTAEARALRQAGATLHRRQRRERAAWLLAAGCVVVALLTR